MNFSTIENSVLEEKKKFNNFLSRFLKNSRVLVMLLTAAVITAVSVSIWVKSPEYQVLYNHLSKEDSSAIVDQLNEMKIPYKLTDISGEIAIPKNKIDKVRSHLKESNFSRDEAIGFELLDKEKFGISQFNEQINYQRALEGELSRTIQKINVIKAARIHIVLPKSSLFLEDKKKPSASVVLELQEGRKLNLGQINAILHLISTSVPNLSVENINIIDQSGQLLNQTSLENDRINDLQFKYSEEIESRYKNRIESILEPLLGFGNVHAQVTAQIDFNSQEETKEKYSPNSNRKYQAIRSRQTSIHDKVEKNNKKENISDNFTNNVTFKNFKNKNTNFLHSDNINRTKNSKNFKNDYAIPIHSNINRENTINYELNHSVSHTKMNIGEIKRLSAAVVINFIKDQNGKLIPLTPEKIKNIRNLICEAIGFSKSRGDSIHVVNASFAKIDKKLLPVKLSNSNLFNELSDISFNLIPWILSAVFFLFFLKRYICPVSKNNTVKNKIIKNEKKYVDYNNDIQDNLSKENIQNNIRTDKLINQISNQNPRTIALIIRQWMSDKI
ncbi:flagellar basal-body MS-ring/collar protein FliF [Buchnera aphidicola]|uniref:Flagellar M-ring protein n=1 Tax=Buchnera aphidicola (Lipaphis pseudobrassicae) TaxID=1258543 RepID=A0A4D6YBS2_9GAMM|nr:flagellar basal-body MS-ring/collar protein FliF [Buchnera aphidicola]QCI21965.1 flagellar basal body M-ring protein FliF [Buchnera aphidicola (Lipaphis pseudobrassicae)]